MKRVLLINDTSRWHCGSAAATAQIVRCIEEAGGTVTKRIATGDFKAEPDWSVVDAVVVNAEGSFHDDQPWALRMIEWMVQAAEADKPVALVNAMWCRMSDQYEKAVDSATNIIVWRDWLSARAYFDGAVAVHVFPDAALMAPLPDPSQHRETYMFGLTPAGWDEPVARKMPVPRKLDPDTWGRYLGILGCFQSYTTLEHHGLLAAMAMGTNIVPISADLYRRGWKNEGLLAWHDDWTNAEKVRERMLSLRAEMLTEYPRLLREFLA